MIDQDSTAIGVAIVAPGGYAPDEVALAHGIAALEAQGCVVHNYYQPAEKYLRFGGTDSARVAQLMAAARDPAVQIVMALRGSYGVSRILPALDFAALADSGKLFVGYSDFTAFNLALMAATGAVSFAGPMLCDDFTRPEPEVSQFTLSNFWQCLRGPTHTVSGICAADSANPAVDVAGPLWGGNLAMLAHLVGSPFMPTVSQTDGGILFLEDVNEHPYRVERMLLQLHQAGILARQKAIVLGDFSSYRLSEYDNGYDFAAMLAFIRKALPVPVLTGLPFGHVRDRATLPVGCQARLRSDQHGFRLEMSAYPTLR
ncbi:MAG: muramoyltetrapeptide carboxypeptidase [Pseudomonadota bacterium]